MSSTHYDFHGVRLQVTTESPAAADALALRLGPFRTARPGNPDIELRYGVDADRGSVPTGRPVYETPYGTVDYVEATDTLTASLAGVGLTCQATIGVAQIAARKLTGFELYLATHPLTTICLMELLKRRERFPLHAGCVELAQDFGALIAGPSGAGKSTLTIALARSGAAFLSDDVVFLTTKDGPLEVLAFPDTLGITEGTTRLFPELRERSGTADAGFPKLLARYEELWPGPLTAKTRPRVLLFPQIVAHESRIEPLDASEAMLRLVPDVLLTQPAGTQSHLKALAALVAQVDCYCVESGPDLEQTANLVRDLAAASV